jgi:hypothetical protein
MGMVEVLSAVEHHAAEIIRICRMADCHQDWATLAGVIHEEAIDERGELEKPLTAIDGGRQKK